MVVFRQALVIFATGTLGFSGMAGMSYAQSAPTAGSGEPSARVGRLAYLQGTVSFHDNDQSDWQPALLNNPITAGDALWTEPNAHGEVSIAGTRVRMDSTTQLDMVALDDRLTRMEVEQGRVDIKTFNYDTRQPYEVVTPRGVVTIQQQGDYYVEAGSTQDPTRLGVREGAAQFRAASGQTVAVRAGEVLEVSGDGSAPQLSTIRTTPPPMPTYWAQRDRQVSYDKPPRYLSNAVTGYEDLNQYGTWKNDPQYGQVWYVNSPPSGWAPYTTGRWVSDPSYGWTWVDEQPWGFAPYHYGRWAQRDNRWFWVPPARQQPAVYAPALVAFLGGLELGNVLGAQNRQPVGWFPLGPREVYVPPYSMNRDYYRRLNFSAGVQQNVLDDRWQRYERREALREDQERQMWMNRRYARVVPAEDFARSRPVERSLIQVAADKLATAPVAAVAAPPRPTESIRALTTERRDDGRAIDRRPANSPPVQAQRPDDRRDSARPAEPVRAATVMGLKPEPEKAKAPGPQIAARPDGRADVKADAKALPQLAPRNASAPAQPKLDGDRRPLNDDKRPEQATAPNRPAAPDRAEPRPGQPGQATLPPVRDRNDKRPEAPHAADQRPDQPHQAGQPPVSRPDSAQPKRDEAQRPGEPAKPIQAAEPKRPDAPSQPKQAETPKPNQAAEPPRQQAEPPKPQQAQPQPPRQAEPARQQAQQPQAQPQHQAEPPKPAAPQPQPAPQPQKPERQGMNAPAPQPQPQHQAAPQPQQHAAPQPQPQAAPQPQQHAAPQPQPQRQPAPQPQQAQAPQPQHQAAPQPQPQRQPSPQPQQAQAPQPQPPQQAQAPQGPHNNNDKK